MKWACSKKSRFIKSKQVVLWNSISRVHWPEQQHTFLLSRTCFGREQKYPCPKWTCARALTYPSPKSSILPPHQPTMCYHPYELVRVFLPTLLFSRKVDRQKEKKKGGWGAEWIDKLSWGHGAQCNLESMAGEISLNFSADSFGRW